MYTHRIAACQLVEGDRIVTTDHTYLVLEAPVVLDSGSRRVKVLRDDWEGPLVFRPETRVSVAA